MAINPIFADSIDLPLVLIFGLVVLVPLLLFEVGIEALILKKIWHIPFRILCRLTLLANCLSLLAGIPLMILNTCLLFLLPDDLPGFFAYYQFAAPAGIVIYFATTVGVEGAYAFRWLTRKGYKISSSRIWMGMLPANLASYAVVAPLHYYFNRLPPQEVNEYSKNANWSSHPETKLIFVGGSNCSLQSMQLGSETHETIVPKTVKDDYLVSADLDLCLFRSTNDVLYLYHRTSAECKFVMQSDYHFMMDWAAFSPSGRYFAYADELNNRLELLDLQAGQKIDQPFIQPMPWEGSVVWSTNESIFYVGLGDDGVIQCTIEPTVLHSVVTLTQTNLVQTNALGLLTCYEQLRDGGYVVMPNDGADGGANFYNLDSSGGLTVDTDPNGLDVYSTTNRRNEVVLLAVNRLLSVLCVPSSAAALAQVGQTIFKPI